MSGWRNVSIGDLVDPVKSWNPLRADGDDVFHYIDLSAVDQDSKAIVGARDVSCAEAPSRARQLVAPHDVLISTVRPNLNAIARVTAELDGATASTGFCVLRPRGSLLNGDYLFQWVKSGSFVADMVKKATGASYPAVSDRIINESVIPLPLLPEQRRIAAILDQADALRAKRREALAQLDSLTQSIFIEMFGDPIVNPYGIRVVPLSAIASRITDGVHQKPNYTESGIPFISVKNITTGTLKFEDCKFISLEDHQKFTKRCKAEYLDILYTKVGATYGRPAIVDSHQEFSLYVSVCLIKPIREKVDSYFLNAALGTAAIKRQADTKIKGIGVPDLHLDQIQSLQLPLPTLEEQRRFANRVASVENQKRVCRTAFAELNTLFASLQHRAFAGQL